MASYYHVMFTFICAGMGLLVPAQATQAPIPTDSALQKDHSEVHKKTAKPSLLRPLLRRELINLRVGQQSSATKDDGAYGSLSIGLFRRRLFFGRRRDPGDPEPEGGDTADPDQKECGDGLTGDGDGDDDGESESLYEEEVEETEETGVQGQPNRRQRKDEPEATERRRRRRRRKEPDCLENIKESFEKIDNGLKWDAAEIDPAAGADIDFVCEKGIPCFEKDKENCKEALIALQDVQDKCKEHAKTKAAKEAVKSSAHSSKGWPMMLSSISLLLKSILV